MRNVHFFKYPTDTRSENVTGFKGFSLFTQPVADFVADAKHLHVHLDLIAYSFANLQPFKEKCINLLQLHFFSEKSIQLQVVQNDIPCSISNIVLKTASAIQLLYTLILGQGWAVLNKLFCAQQMCLQCVHVHVLLWPFVSMQHESLVPALQSQ